MSEYDPADWWKGDEPEREPEPSGVYVSGITLPDGTCVASSCNTPFTFTREGDR